MHIKNINNLNQIIILFHAILEKLVKDNIYIFLKTTIKLKANFLIFEKNFLEYIHIKIININKIINIDSIFFNNSSKSSTCNFLFSIK